MTSKRNNPQSDLFAQPLFVVDTSSILNFWKKTSDEPYGFDVFEGAWQQIETMMEEGKIIAPESVKIELETWIDTIPELKEWLRDHANCFQPKTSDQLKAAAVLINKYPKYATNKKYEADLMVSALAMAYNLGVITSEAMADPHSPDKPKIPNVCEENGINPYTLYDFFKAQGTVFVVKT